MIEYASSFKCLTSSWHRCAA